MITITLKNVGSASKGVNFDSYIKSYFASFGFEGWPYITGGAGQYDGNQLILLDNLAGRNTKTMVLDGTGFSYDLSKHIMSGTLKTIKLGTLGDSYQSGGSFQTDGAGRIVNVSAPVEITGLSIANGAGVRGDFHNLTSGLMGGVSASHKADASILKDSLASEAIRLVGSAGADTFTGTKFSDIIRGNAGNDVLNGGLGKDQIRGDAGKDKIYGGNGADKLWGGADADVFVYKSVADSTVRSAGRDTIYDFSLRQDDRIDLRGIDAKADRGGNQAFTFIGKSAFHDVAGELRYATVGKNTYLYGDVNGDGVADFAIHLKGALALTKGDFYL
ncbi:calcium-binding protein [Microvirga antarctica]|uniref:calcium-binding protein n=1 Tax=Microvirga antarctica TaxID=2819233 RepID=UPI001B3131B5|nr:calcium-binding protein [Microvirga antarctica]